MSGIPYNELQDVNCTVNDTDGTQHTIATLHYAFVIPCRDCKHYRFIDRSDIFQDDRHNDSFCLRFVDGKRMEVEPDGFCAWGERRDT